MQLISLFLNPAEGKKWQEEARMTMTPKLFVSGIFWSVHVDVYPKSCAKSPLLPNDEAFLSTKAGENGKAKASASSLHRTVPGRLRGDNISFQTVANQAERADLTLPSCKPFQLCFRGKEVNRLREASKKLTQPGGERVRGKARFAPGIAWHSGHVTGCWLEGPWVSFPDLRLSSLASPRATFVLNTGFNEQEHVYHKP